MSQKITVIEVDEKKLWEGVKVRNKGTYLIRSIFIIPEGKTVSQVAALGIYHPEKHVLMETVMNNKSRFEILEENLD